MRILAFSASALALVACTPTTQQQPGATFSSTLPFATDTSDTSNGVVGTLSMSVPTSKWDGSKMVHTDGAEVEIVVDLEEEGIDTYLLSVNIGGTSIPLTVDNGTGTWTAKVGNFSYDFAGFIGSDLTNAIFGFLTIYDDETWESVPFILGQGTDPAQIAALNGSATFAGDGFIDLGNSDGTFDNIFATISVDANFGAGTVSGAIKPYEVNHYDVDANLTSIDNPTTVEITLESTDISGNAFAGDISLTATDFGMTTFTSGTYGGYFAGVDAKAAVGVIGGTGANDDGLVSFVGGFVADKQ